ncbi:GNAT family N-acetyltransferase [Aquibacillus kalidii]|uniref:GNAT family N-acetyltransferase n=1 Tax=Aquibacillus kalidii TaxID=2762597 RepID=UPI001647182E|nr:GNAT family N-acetyltransferase [Aquibacillus kalidii]
MNGINKVNKNEYEKVIELSEYAFQYTVTPEQIRKRCKEMEESHIIYGSYVNGELAAKLHLLPMTLGLGGIKMPFGGIAGVSTWPEYRRKGHVANLMNHTLYEMKIQGLSISMLHPFSIDFYRRFGWELTHYNYHYTFSPSDLKNTKGKGYSKRGTKDTDLPLLKSIYHKNSSQYNLFLDREDWWWLNKVIADEDSIVIYYDENGDAQGYLIASLSESRLTVKEIIFLTGDACYGLLEWLKNHDSMIKEIEMKILPNDQLSFYFHNPRINIKKSAYFMTRIVDFSTFIRKYPFFNSEDPISIVMEIKDELAPWNEGMWEIEISNNKVTEVNRVSSTNSQLKITTDILSLSALLFNSEPIEHLIKFNKLKVEGDFIVWENLIMPNKPALLDFF